MKMGTTRRGGGEGDVGQEGEGEEKDGEGSQAQEDGCGGELEQGDGIVGSGVEQQALGLPENASEALEALARAMPPPHVPITAAFHRPRRSTAGSLSR